MSIDQHFRAAEQPLVERVLDWSDRVSRYHMPHLTDFLDPREQFIVRSVAGSYTDISVAFHGGYEQAERKRGLIVPEYGQTATEDFQVALLALDHSPLSRPVEHRDVLGSLLGLGVKRAMFGDILISERGVQVIVAREMAEFVELHLRQIGRTKVTCTAVDWSVLQAPDEQWKTVGTTVSSLRLDVILAELIRLSRTKTVQLIKAGRVKVNWKVEQQPAVTLAEGDVLSVKGYGRFLFDEIEGLTKKEKYRIRLGRKN